MSKIFNPIGSLTTLKSQLNQNRIYDFKSLNEVIDFQNSYSDRKQKIIGEHEYLIEQEKARIQEELNELGIEINVKRIQAEESIKAEIDSLKRKLNSLTEQRPKNLFLSLLANFKKRILKSKIQAKELNYAQNVTIAISNLIILQKTKSDRYEFINSHFQQAVQQSADSILSELEQKKRIIDSLNPLIYGAIGELKVVKVIESLPDDYTVINDFYLTFHPAIFYPQEQEYIKSIQIDHLLIGPSGVFIIETKNWSSQSLENLNLRSPVEQIRRTSYVLYRLLHNGIGDYQLNLDPHHWGNKKIVLKNLIVLINNKPNEEFQYVKVLTLNELLKYITYFKPIYSALETERMTEYLLGLGEIKEIRTR